MNKIILPKDSLLNSPEFIYGVATASFQIEGGRESREENIWDVFCNQPDSIADHSNGNVACNHFNSWSKDIDLIHSLNVDAYRFSISWTRVINNDGSVNQQGIDFYHNVLDKLNEYGIKAFVTLYHWDLPQYIEDKGGWLNRDTAYYFKNYVDVVSRAFKGKVYSYCTLNEPYCSAHLGYEMGIHAPGIIGKQFGKKAGHHLLLAHGLAMQVLQVTSPETKNGIVLNVSPTYAATSSDDDLKATAIADQDINHWYIKPILEGQYPDLLTILPEEYQPDIFEADLKIISTPIDYLGLNYYTRAIIKSSVEELYDIKEPSSNELTEMGWEVYPKGYFDILTRLNNDYQLPPIYLTENGMASIDRLDDNQVNDCFRLKYIQDHLQAVHQAIDAGVDIQTYFAWSLMDNFEWAEGYVKRFGLVYVDYETQQRTIKMSGKVFSEFLSSRSMNVI